MTTDRKHFLSGVSWEEQVGYARALRVGDQIFVSGSTAASGERFVGEGDAHAQARQAIANIQVALERLGGSLEDVVRTRLFVTDIRRDWQEIGRAHRDAFSRTKPATSMLEVSRLIDDRMLVEIEADAIVRL